MAAVTPLQVLDQYATLDIGDVHFPVLTFKYKTDEARKAIDELVDELNTPCERSQLTCTVSNVNVIDFLGSVLSMYKEDTEHGTAEQIKRDYEMLLKAWKVPSYAPLPLCRVHKRDPDAVLPTKAHASDAGYDLTIIKKHKQINSKVTMYDTGIALCMCNGYYAEIVPRSSIIKSGYILANNIGIIDTSYTGNLYVALAKIDDGAPDIQLPFRGFQIIFRPQINMQLCSAPEQELTETQRGDGGFGSTGT